MYIDSTLEEKKTLANLKKRLDKVLQLPDIKHVAQSHPTPPLPHSTKIVQIGTSCRLVLETIEIKFYIYVSIHDLFCP